LDVARAPRAHRGHEIDETERLPDFVDRFDGAAAAGWASVATNDVEWIGFLERPLVTTSPRLSARVDDAGGARPA
jgi:hypothetical protein